MYYIALNKVTKFVQRKYRETARKTAALIFKVMSTSTKVIRRIVFGKQAKTLKPAKKDYCNRVPSLVELLI